MISSILVPLVVAVIAAVAAVYGATMSARSARLVASIETQAQTIRDLDSRISERKHTVYKPMIDLLNKLTDPRTSPLVTANQQVFLDTITNFSAWVAIYGSDRAVLSYQRYMQALYASAPVEVVMSLYGDFVLEARRDMGYPNTEINVVHLLGMRISDVYESNLAKMVLMPFEDLCNQLGWIPPWER